MGELIVTHEAFPYLVVQKGRLDRLKHDRPAWEAAYRASIAETMAEIAPWLPQSCATLLDVGGGMGGIDAALNQHYGGGLAVEILDGLDDPPVMKLHRQTFNHAGVAERFLRANGVQTFRAIGPAEAVAEGEVRGERVDLVVSFGAWCFHIEPAVYLPYVVARCQPGTVLILDVRNGQDRWAVDLADVFTPMAVIRQAEKFTRVVLHV